MPASTRKPSIPLDDSTPSCYTDTHGVMTTTTNTLPGYRITKHLGTIYGLTVRSRNWGADIGGFFRSSIGGELRVYTHQLYRARNEAMDRMVGECMGRGGNAILGVRFDVVAESVWSQVCAYGTAVVVEEIKHTGERRAGEEAEEDV